MKNVFNYEKYTRKAEQIPDGSKLLLAYEKVRIAAM
jgi:hypothetical protein